MNGDAPVVTENLGASSQQQLTKSPNHSPSPFMSSTLLSSAMDLGIVDVNIMTSDADSDMTSAFNITDENQNEWKSQELALGQIVELAYVRVRDTTRDKIKLLV